METDPRVIMSGLTPQHIRVESVPQAGYRSPGAALAATKAHQNSIQGLDRVRTLRDKQLNNASWTADRLSLQFGEDLLTFAATPSGVLASFKPGKRLCLKMPDRDVLSLHFGEQPDFLWSRFDHASHRLECRFHHLFVGEDHFSLFIQERPILIISALKILPEGDPLLFWRDDLDERYDDTVEFMPDLNSDRP